MVACVAIDKLTVSLQALRMALTASDLAPAELGLPDDDGHLTEACELRNRWTAASLLLNAAVTTVQSDGTGVIKAIKTMLALE